MSARWSHDFFCSPRKIIHETKKTSDLQQHINLQLFNVNQYKEVSYILNCVTMLSARLQAKALQFDHLPSTQMYLIIIF